MSLSHLNNFPIETMFSELSNLLPFSREKAQDRHLCIEEVEVEVVVVENLGISCSPEDRKFRERLGSDHLLNLFEEKEPSVEELKEALDVFDVAETGSLMLRSCRVFFVILGSRRGYAWKTAGV
ncbi:calcium-binding EF-hand family protein [Actinidia rufa]|uniref:Calcium-binding EF-hand family protein n=1 Tax=Actinidia rufa TaxID=165716 RepID=A0A7J0DA91_9ERIC|nr:calcium-binding EF-hand family protein [Actinidia rufa]